MTWASLAWPLTNGLVRHHWLKKIEEALQTLDQRGYLYEQDSNIWFKSTEFGDEKDRVVKRRNGQTTYFASDIAYH